MVPVDRASIRIGVRRTCLTALLAPAMLVFSSCNGGDRPGPPAPIPFDGGNTAAQDDDETTSPADDDTDDDGVEPTTEPDPGEADNDVPAEMADAGDSPATPEPEPPPVPMSTVSPPGISVGHPPSLTPDPLPIPPQNCESVSEANNDTECEVESECDEGDYLYTHCVQEEDSWSCECDSNQSFQRYALAGVDVASACGVAADLCDTSVAPDYGDTSECSATVDSSDETHCEQQLSCGRSAVLDDDVEVNLNEVRTVACDVDDAGSLQCRCTVPGVARSFVLTDIALTDACSTVVDLCPNDVPEFEGQARCAADYEFQTDEYCERQVACERTADVSEGIMAQDVDYEYVHCEAGENGTRCSCADATRTFSFDVERPRANAGTCTAINELCRSETPSAPSGAITCNEAGRSDGEEYCEVNFECAQSAEFGTESINLLGNAYAYCTLDTGTEWTCTCRSGSEEGTLTLDAAEQSACTDLGERCQDVVDIAIGPN